MASAHRRTKRMRSVTDLAYKNKDPQALLILGDMSKVTSRTASRWALASLLKIVIRSSASVPAGTEISFPFLPEPLRELTMVYSSPRVRLTSLMAIARRIFSGKSRYASA
jgi:hypothetical protein